MENRVTIKSPTSQNGTHLGAFFVSDAGVGWAWALLMRFLAKLFCHFLHC